MTRPPGFQMGLQFSALVVLSIALGTVFNSANPIGIRWKPPLEAKTAAVPVKPAAAPAAAILPPSAVPGALFPSVTWQEVKPLLEQQEIVLVDARTKPTYDAGHIPGSVSLPNTGSPEQIQAFRQQHPPGAALVIYCAGLDCKASELLAAKLAPLGYSNIRVMREGYSGWLRAENPAAAAPASISTGAAESSSGPVATTWVAIQPLVDSGGAILVDVRPAPSYQAGHIPGAVSLPEGSVAEKIAEFQTTYNQDVPLVIYCMKTTCPISKRVGEKLMNEYGYRTVYYLSGGYEEWQQAQLSVSRN